MVDFNALINKARDFARKNPDKVKQATAKLEQVVGSKTGGKYDDQIHQGLQKAEEQLGVPAESPATPPAEQAATPGEQPGTTAQQPGTIPAPQPGTPAEGQPPAN